MWKKLGLVAGALCFCAVGAGAGGGVALLFAAVCEGGGRHDNTNALAWY